MIETSYSAMVKAAAILRNVTIADASAEMIMAAHMEAEQATTTNMVEIFDRVMATKPHLIAPVGQQENAPAMPNPFRKGPHWNMTQQAVLMNTQPELASRLRNEAAAGAAR
jgi:hypothetical protein